jgi:hypothetical protein
VNKGITLNNSPVLVVYFRLLIVEKILLGEPSGAFSASISHKYPAQNLGMLLSSLP